MKPEDEGLSFMDFWAGLGYFVSQSVYATPEPYRPFVWLLGLMVALGLGYLIGKEAERKWPRKKRR